MTEPLEPMPQSNLDEWLESLKQTCVYCIEAPGGPRFYDEADLPAKVKLILENYDENEFPSLMLKTLAAIIEIQECRTEGDADGAIQLAIRLGELLHQADNFDKHLAGLRAIQAGRKAAKATWGTKKQRTKKKAALVRMFKEARPKCPSNDGAYAVVAGQSGTTKRTVRRAVTGY
jgi:hypothetical protein